MLLLACCGSESLKLFIYNDHLKFMQMEFPQSDSLLAFAHAFLSAPGTRWIKSELFELAVEMRSLQPRLFGHARH